MSNVWIYNQNPAVGDTVSATNFENVIIENYTALTSNYANVPYGSAVGATTACFYNTTNIWSNSYWDKEGVTFTVSNFTWTKA